MEEKNLEVVVEFEFLVSLEDVPINNDFCFQLILKTSLG